MTTTFGAHLRGLRLKAGLTLRKFCLETGINPGNQSRYERDRLPPPSRKTLEGMARCLGFLPDTPEWEDFFNRADAAKGTVPKDLLSDEEVVARLPVLFRVLRYKNMSDKSLDEIVEIMKRS